MKQLERKMQSAVVKFIGEHYQDGFVFHIPNGGKRGKIEAAIFKGMGVVAGVPDLCVVRPFGSVSWIEMKAGPSEKPSPSQIAVHGRLKQLGHQVEVVYDLSQMELILRRWKTEDMQTREWNPRK